MRPKDHGHSVGTVVHIVCPYCGKEFRGDATTSGVRSNYRRHLLTHTGERPCACPYCSAAFATSSNLRRHISLLHSQQLTPTNGPQATEVADDGDIPFAELALPAAVATGSTGSSSSIAPRQGRRKTHQQAAAGGEASPSTASATEQSLDGVEGDAVSTRPPPKPSVAFVCEDCELEVSSRPKLNRHKRYYCPFRDDIFVDPVQDAVERYRAEHALLQHEEAGSSATEAEEDDAEDGEEASSCSSSAFAGDDAVRCCSGPSFPSRRRRQQQRKRASALSLTENEKTYLTRVAAQSGLKFVEDAYASDSGSGSEESEGEETEDSAYSSFSSTSSAGDRHDRTPPRGSAPSSPRPKATPSPSLAPLSPRGTPLHGPLPPLGRLSLPSSRPQHSSEVEEGDLLHSTQATPGTTVVGGAVAAAPSNPRKRRSHSRSNAEEAADGVNPGEDLLHVHFHRRRSGHRRERHILQKRLRAQEGALLGLTNSPLRRPRQQHRREASTRAEASSTQQRSQAQVAPIVLSEHLLARADLLTMRDRRTGHADSVGVSSELVCPYCDDFTSFSHAHLLTRHMRRVHPVEAARNAARATERSAAHNSDDGDATDLPE